MSWGKLYTSTFTGSMAGSGPTVFAVWTYIVAHVRHSDHSVELNTRILAATLGTSAEDVDKAIEFLSSPDPQSRSEEHEGRRLIKEGAFLYHVVNAAKYQSLRDDDARREYQRELMRKKRKGDPNYGRKKLNDKGKKRLGVVSHGEPQLAHEDVEVDVEVKQLSSRERAADLQNQIQQLYQAYPRREGKGAALKAIEKALQAAGIPFEQLLERVKKFASSPAGNAGRFVPHPATWFNQRRFEDDPKEWSRANQQSTQPSTKGAAFQSGTQADEIREILERNAAPVSTETNIQQRANGSVPI